MDDLIKELLEEVKPLEGEKDMLAAFKKSKMSDSEIATTQAALRLLSSVSDQVKKSGVVLKAFEVDPPKTDATAAAAFLKSCKPEEKAEIAKSLGIEADRFAQVFEKEKGKPPTGLVLKADGTLDLDQVPEALRPAMQVLFKDSTDTKAALKTANEKIEKAEKENQHKVWLEKAAEFKDLPSVNVEELATTLSKLEDDDAEKIMKQLRANKEAIDKGALFTEHGRGGGGPAPGSAIERVNQLATGLVQKNDKLSEAEAVQKVLADNPTLYTEYVKETQIRA